MRKFGIQYRAVRHAERLAETDVVASVGYADGPYAYGSRAEPHMSGFWKQPFGAARRLADLDGIVAFFRAGAPPGEPT